VIAPPPLCAHNFAIAMARDMARGSADQPQYERVNVTSLGKTTKEEVRDRERRVRRHRRAGPSDPAHAGNVMAALTRA
jgi:hypothetical protein